MTDLESAIRSALSQEADTISPANHGAESLVRAVIRRRRRSTAVLCAAAIVPAGGAVIVALRAGAGATELATPAPSGPTPPPSPTTTMAPDATSTADSTPTSWPPSAPLGSDVEMSCADSYSVPTLSNRTFAFDGTVASISPGSGLETPGMTVEVEFRINEWFRGGTASTATVSMFRPGASISVDEGTVGAWDIGSRLLITGEPRWGGEPLDDAVAWYCGFSRTYDPSTADTWRTVLDANAQPGS